MLSDVVQDAGLEGFAEVGLVLFVIGFVLMVLRVALLSSEEADRHAELPFDDETSAGSAGSER